MLRDKKIYFGALIFLAIPLVYFSYSVQYGFNGSFSIYNGYMEQELISKIFTHDSLGTEKFNDAMNRDPRPIDIMILVNREVLYKGSVPSYPDYYSYEPEPIYFTNRLKFGHNIIQIYSNELNAYTEISMNTYVGQHFEIFVKNESELFKKGEFVDLEKIANMIESGVIEDYSTKNHDQIFYNGFSIRRSVRFFWSF